MGLMGTQMVTEMLRNGSKTAAKSPENRREAGELKSNARAETGNILNKKIFQPYTIRKDPYFLKCFAKAEIKPLLLLQLTLEAEGLIFYMVDKIPEPTTWQG